MLTMARLLRLAPNPRRLSTASAIYADKLFKELLYDESSEAKREKLELLQCLFERAEAQEKMLKIVLERAEVMETRSKLALDISALALERSALVEAALTLELLHTKGLNDTRGLFEYLEEKVLAKSRVTSRERGSKATWSLVLQADPEFLACLRTHLGASINPAAHLVEIHNVLSQHVHTGKNLSQRAGKIVFEADFLSAEQSLSLTCLGAVVGIKVEPAPQASIANNV